MKLRYTPYQVKVDAVEDHESKYHDVINNFESLEGMPVVVGTLHSMLTPFVASYKRHNPNKKLGSKLTRPSLCALVGLDIIIVPSKLSYSVAYTFVIIPPMEWPNKYIGAL